MSRHTHRFSGWPDLKSTVVTILALTACAAFAATQSEVFTDESPDEPDWKPRVASPDDHVFLGPFINASFLKAVQAELAEIQILRERSTGVYYDKKSQLVWSANDNGRDIDWRRANDYCFELELAGFDDWRLPTLEELEDLMEPIASGLYSTPDQISLSSCCVWSSTRRDQSAWNFNYRFSKRFSGSLTYTFDLRALCVRAWSDLDDWDPLAEIEIPTPTPDQ